MLKILMNASHARQRVGAEQWVGRISLSVAVGVAYFLAADIGLSILTATERVAVFWPASGIAAGVLIAFGRRASAPVAVAVIVASAAVALLTDRNVWSALAFGFCNAGEALLVMWLIERWFGTAFNLDSVRRVLGFFAAAALAPAMAAVGAAAAMKLLGPSTAGFVDIWEVWFASDALGIIAVAPLLIGIAAAVHDAPSRRELLEGTLAVVAIAATNGFALALLAGPWSLIAPAIFLFPLLLWVSSRCRPVFAAAAAFFVVAAIVWTTIHEFGRYGDPTRAIADRTLAAQMAILGTALAALALAAVFAERRAHEMALRESRREAAIEPGCGQCRRLGCGSHPQYRAFGRARQAHATSAEGPGTARLCRNGRNHSPGGPRQCDGAILDSRQHGFHVPTGVPLEFRCSALGHGGGFDRARC